MSLLDELKPQIDKHSIISFDIFDTLLLRPYVKPTDLFLHLERLEDAKGFAKARVEAEKQARKTHSDLEDINIDEIYDEIPRRYKVLKEAEMALESKVLVANLEMKDIYNYALAQNKKIIIISDMYLPEDFLRKTLNYQGYRGFKLFVSNEIRKKKVSGTMYDYLLEEMDVQPQNILHIGDNKGSDFNVPMKKNIDAYYYEQVIARYLKQNEKAKLFLDKYPDNLEASVMIMNFALHWLTNQEEDFWSRIGYEYGGPMCYAYMRWVEQQVLKKQIKEILFVARDGYSLQKVFDSFGHKDIKTHYVYAPRQVYVNCFINEAIKNKRELSILKGYGEKSEEIAKVAHIIKDRETANKYIKENFELFKKIENEERQNYVAYINSLKVGKNACIVDTTSSLLSSVHLLSNVLNYKPLSLFWVLYDVALKAKGFKLKSFCSKLYTNKYIVCWDFYEYMMTAPEPPIADVNEDGVIYVNPIPRGEIDRIALYERVQKSILEFSDNIKKYAKLNFTERLITEWVNILFTNLNKEEVEIFSLVDIANDISHKIYRKLIRIDRDAIKNQIGTMITNINNTKELCKKISIMKIPLIKKYKISYLSNTNDKNIKTIVRFLGIPLFKRVKNLWLDRASILGIRIYSYKEKESYRMLHILGLPVWKEEGQAMKMNKLLSHTVSDNNDVLLNKLNRILERKLSTFYLHQQTFPQFRGINRGKDVVIIATGPSLTQFKPIENAVYIGVNRAVQYDKVHYNYYFVQDYSGATPSYMDEVYKYKNCKKFLGLTNENSAPDKTIPQKYRIGKDIYSYRTDWEVLRKFETKFAYDLATTALGCGGTVVLPAIQFALWTHPKRIYLVGCDTTTSGYFDMNVKQSNFLYPEALKERYKEIKAFAHQYYPDVEIISINPVGLKGIFKDEYQ